MLPAVLRRKLDAATPDPQRLEDGLTAAVFGLLIYLGQWDLLRQWLDIPPSNGPRDCWFWPRLKEAEPDVVLRIGQFLVVVEAKLSSGRHDRPTDEDKIGDQLKRQWVSVTQQSLRQAILPATLRNAAEECVVRMRYVTDARKSAQTSKELQESGVGMPREVLSGVTWQRLDGLLVPLVEARWARDLRAYLDICGLTCFRGAWAESSRLDPSVAAIVKGWRSPISGQRLVEYAVRVPAWTERVMQWRRRAGRQDLQQAVTEQGWVRVLRSWGPWATRDQKFDRVLSEWMANEGRAGLVIGRLSYLLDHS